MPRPATPPGPFDLLRHVPLLTQAVSHGLAVPEPVLPPQAEAGVRERVGERKTDAGPWQAVGIRNTSRKEAQVRGMGLHEGVTHGGLARDSFAGDHADRALAQAIRCRRDGSRLVPTAVRCDPLPSMTAPHIYKHH